MSDENQSRSQPTEPDASSALDRPWWAGTTVAAAMTAVFTVLVAISAFLSASAASDSDDNYATSNLALTDANFFFEQGVDSLIEELAVGGQEVDRVCVLGLVDDSAADLCGDISELEDLTVDDPVFNAGFEAQEDAEEAYAVGLKKSKESVDLQAALVLFAVGLALSAWASLSDMARRSRVVFLALALVALAVGVIRLLTV
jgi:hypothetical protein